MAPTSTPNGASLLDSLPDDDLFAGLPDQGAPEDLLAGLPDQETPRANPLDGLSTEIEQDFATTAQGLRDLTAKAAQGALAFGPAMLSAADTLLPYSNASGALHRTVGYDPKAVRDTVGELLLSEKQQKVEKGAAGLGAVDTLKYVSENPMALAGVVAESLPSAMGGAALAKGVTSALPLVTRAALGEGIVTMGQAATQVQGEQNYKTLTPKQRALLIASGGLTAKIGQLGGQLANRSGATDIEQALAGAEGKAVTPAAVTKSAGIETGEETLQGGQEQAATNLAMGQPWEQGVGGAMTMGGLAGGAMGGGAALVNTPTTLPEKPNSLQGQIDAFVEGRKPAVLFTEGEEVPPLPEGAKIARVAEGVLMYSDEAVLELAKTKGVAAALGYGVERKPAPEATVGVVVARDAQGRAVQEVAVDAGGIQAATIAAWQVAGSGGTVTLEPLPNVLAQRDTEVEQVARAQVSETARMEGVIAQQLDEADFDPSLEAALAEAESNPVTEEMLAEAERQLQAMEDIAELNRDFPVEEGNDDLPRLNDMGRSLTASRNRGNYENPNDGKALADSIVTVAAKGKKEGVALRDVPLAKGEVVGVGEASELYPEAYRRAVVDTLTQVLGKLGSSAKVVVQFQTLGSGQTAKVTPLGNGAYAINPANLTNFEDPSKFNEVTQAEAAYSLAHEVGHIIVWEELQKGMSEADKLIFDTLPEGALFDAAFLARQTEEVRAVLTDYNQMKTRVLNGSMSAAEFLNTWMGPAKAAWGMRARVNRGQTFGQNAVGQFWDFSKMTALQFASAFPAEARILSPEEWAAEQMARYAHDKKLLDATPLGSQAFFKRVLEKVRAFFKEMKIAKVMAAGTAFTEFVDALTLRKVENGGRSSRIKFPQSTAASAAAPKAKPKPSANKGLGPIAEEISHNLPEAFRTGALAGLALTQKAPKVKVQAAAPVADARALAVAAVKRDLADVREENPDAYAEMLALAKSGQLAALREIAEDYVGEKTVGKWRFSYDPVSLDFSDVTPRVTSVPWTFSAARMVAEKAPEIATVDDWLQILRSWAKQARIKQLDLDASGLEQRLAELEGPNLRVTKATIVSALEQMSGPLDVVVQRGGESTYPAQRPKFFQRAQEDLDDYVELLFHVPEFAAEMRGQQVYRKLPMAGHFTATQMAQGIAVVMHLRATVLTDTEGRKGLYVHEVQSDAGQDFTSVGKDAGRAVLLPNAPMAAMFDKDGKFLTLTSTQVPRTGSFGEPIDEQGNVVADGRVRMREGTVEEITRYFNKQRAGAKQWEQTPYAKSTDRWAGVVLRAAMRFAADSNLSWVALATAKEQDEVQPSDAIGWNEDSLFISQNGEAAEVVPAKTGVEVMEALLPYYKYGQLKRVIKGVLERRAKEPISYVPFEPRAEGMAAFYGEAGGHSVLRGTMKKLLKPFGKGETIPVVLEAQGETRETLAYPIPSELRTRPVDYFSYDMPERFPELEELTAQVEQLGVKGEMKQMMRKTVATGWKMARALAAPQQFAFANPDVVGLQYHNKVASDYQAYRGRLEAQATDIARSWAALGKEQLANLHAFLQEEYELGQHWAELTKGKAEWQFLPSETFAEKAKEHGVSESTAALALRVKQSMLQHMNALERTLASKAMRKYKGHSAVLRVKLSEISQMFSNLRSQPFLPQSRFGEYGVQVVEYTLDGEELMHQEFFQTEEQRDEAVKALQGKLSSKQYRVEAKNWRNGMHTYKNIPPEVLNTVAKELALTDGQQAQLLAMLDKSRESRTLRSFSRELAKVTGRNRDLLRNYGDFMRHDSALLAKLRYREEFGRAAQAVERDITLLDAETRKDEAYLKERQRLENILQVMQEHSDYMMNPREEWQALKALVVLWQLWGVAKTALANITAIIPVIADITAHFGTLHGLKYITIAGAKTTMSGMQFLNSTGKKVLKMQVEDATGHLSEDELWAITKAKNNAVLDQTFSAQLADFADAGVLQRLAGSQINNYAQLFMRMGMLPIHLVELYVRHIAFLAKFNLYMTAGLPREEAYDLAAEETKLTVGDSSRANRPPFMRGRKAAFTIYYGFTQLMMYMFSGQYEKGYKRRQEQLARAGYKVKVRTNRITGMTARMWLMFAMLGGVAGGPGEEDLRAALRLIAQRLFGRDFDLDLEVRKMVAELNDKAEDFGLHVDPNLLMHGLSHNVAGFDLSGSVGFGKIVPGLATLGDSTGEPMDTALAGAGPLGGFVSGFIRALTQDAPTKAMQVAPALPSVVRNALMATDWAQRGVRYNGGARVTRDLATGEIRDLTTGELLMKGLGGFNPTIVAQNREKNFAKLDATMFWMERKSRLYANLAEALRQGDREAVADTERAVAYYNEHCPPGMQIQAKQLRQSLKGRGRAAGMKEAGVPQQKGQRPAASEVDKLF